MFLLVINGVFAGVAAGIARIAFKQALPLLRVGWTAIDAAVNKPDFRHNIESRLQISEGGYVLISGILWALSALVAASAAVFFSLEVLRLLG